MQEYPDWRVLFESVPNVHDFILCLSIQVGIIHLFVYQAQLYYLKILTEKVHVALNFSYKYFSLWMIVQSPFGMGM